MLKLDHWFFAPAWRRYSILALCFGWALFEFSRGSTGWAAIFGAIGAVAAWEFWTIDWSKYDEE